MANDPRPFNSWPIRWQRRGRAHSKWPMYMFLDCTTKTYISCLPSSQTSPTRPEHSASTPLLRISEFSSVNFVLLDIDFHSTVTDGPGPVIGGIFAEPAKQLPHTIGRIPLFQWYPYLLPCLITAVYTFIALIASIFLLDEPAHRERDEKVPLRQLMTPTLFNVMLIYGFAMFLGIANS